MTIKADGPISLPVALSFGKSVLAVRLEKTWAVQLHRSLRGIFQLFEGSLNFEGRLFDPVSETPTGFVQQVGVVLIE